MSTIADVFGGRAAIDFRPKWRISLVVSTGLVLAALAFLLLRGLNPSIDFQGGGVWEVPVSEDVTVADARDALSEVPGARIQLVESTVDTYLHVQTGTEAVENSSDVTAQVAELAGVTTDEVAVSNIGPTWGDQITSKAIRALVLFFIVVAAYLAWRLEWRMAIGALVAVVHDLLITAGVYSLFGFEVSPATVIALLTILGYSLYDTVVVYDKVLENERGPLGDMMSPSDLVNKSMNQVLMRSINTTITTILPVVSMLLIGGFLLGGTGLRGFALALFVGLLLGTYSSIFLAAPLLVWLRERTPEGRKAAERSRRAADNDEVAPMGSTLATSVDDNDVRLITPGGGAPRPRKKGRKS